MLLHTEYITVLCSNKSNILYECFSLFLLGSVWVYRIYGDVVYDDPNSNMYCDKTAYLFAFAIITMVYAFMALAVLCCFCACVAICCCAGKD